MRDPDWEPQIRQRLELVSKEYMIPPDEWRDLVPDGFTEEAMPSCPYWSSYGGTASRSTISFPAIQLDCGGRGSGTSARRCLPAHLIQAARPLTNY